MSCGTKNNGNFDTSPDMKLYLKCKSILNCVLEYLKIKTGKSP